MSLCLHGLDYCKWARVLFNECDRQTTARGKFRERRSLVARVAKKDRKMGKKEEKFDNRKIFPQSPSITACVGYAAGSSGCKRFVTWYYPIERSASRCKATQPTPVVGRFADAQCIARVDS